MNHRLISLKGERMKRILILSAAASAMIFAGGDIKPVEPVVETTAPQAAESNGSFGDALKHGKYSANMRLFYMDRSFDEDKTGKPDTKALTFGGIMKYESGDYRGFKFGLAYYGSHKVGNFFDREEGRGTSLLQSNGDDIAFLGEAYLQYTLDNTLFKVGRQRLSTPLMQDHDLRLLPSTYEAVIIRNTDLPDTMVELGYVKRYSGFTSKLSGFDDQDTKWGKDGLASIYLKNKSIENLTLRGQYIKALSDTDNTGATVAISDYKYADLKYALPVGTGTYIKAQYGGNSYNNADDSTLVGAKAGTTLFGMVDLAVLYDKISGNSFKAVESGPMYSDWQQGYGPYEPSTAYGGQIIVKPIDGLSVKLGYVDVNSDTDKLIDDFTEFNLDAKYTINDWSKIRVRYSIKDQSSASEALRYDGIDGNGGREDRDDFRIIYYMNF